MTAVAAIGEDPAERALLRRAARLHDVLCHGAPDRAALYAYAARLRGGESVGALAALLAQAAGVDGTTLEALAAGDPAAAHQRLMPILFPGGTSPGHGIHYRWWLEENDTPSEAERAHLRGRLATLPTRPRLSFVVPARQATDADLSATLESLTHQLYPDVEIVVVSPRRRTPPATEPRMRVVAAAERTRAAQVNAGLHACTGDFVGVVDAGDTVSEVAAFEAVDAIVGDPALRILFSDEDSVHPDGRRHSPRLKTDWDPDAMLAQDQAGRLALFATALVRELGGLREAAGSWGDYDLMLRASRAVAPAQIKHLAAILYHRLTRPAPWWSRFAPEPPDRRAALVREHLAALGAAGCTVSAAGTDAPLRVVYPLPAEAPLVSVIVPTKDRLDLLRPCLDGLLHKTDYPALEILLVDNASREPATRAYLANLDDPRVRVIDDPSPFNWSAINNRTAASARGTVLLFLNNDIEMLGAGWLRELAAHALRPEVGAVGAKLLYPDGRIQHAGMAVGPDHGPTSHPWTPAPGDEPGYLNCRAIVHNASAVTGACLAMRAAVFDELGGFDAVNLPISSSDPDLCLRARARGYRVIWTPHACLIHKEGATRGPDQGERLARFRREETHLRATWGAVFDYDPFLNPNLSRFAADPLMVPRSPVVRSWQRP
jgi:GT2 family glycosyltransferase